MKKEVRGPEGARIYAIGDIHGRADLLARMRDTIQVDLEGWSGAVRTVFLGDYIDRGPDSAAVIETVSGGGFPGAVFLKGNHEDMLLRFLDDPQLGDLWRRNGAVETLVSYGVDVRQLMIGQDLAAAAKELAEKLPSAHRAFFEGLRFHHREGDYFFCHAGIRPGVPLDAQSQEDLIWIREEFLHSPRDHGAVVVHGHTPAAEPEVRPNRINLDTGAYLTNVLTCLVIEGAGRRLLQATPAGPRRIDLAA